MRNKKSKEIKCPFQNESGQIVFPYQAIFDKVFIWPYPDPKTFEKNGLIEIPTIFRDKYKLGIGILLSVGQGYYDKKSKFNPTDSRLIPGIKVSFYKSVPWREVATGVDGKEYIVMVCGTADIHGLVED